jgi:hypothetical protein
MSASKVKRNISPDGLQETQAAVVDDKKQGENKRRFADSLKPKSRKLKLDRRVTDEERRSDGSNKNKGPARRKILDQRESQNDRRDED